jgi:ABC-2 type transport system permease protein
MQPFLLLFVFTYVFPRIGQGVGGSGEAEETFSTLLMGGAMASAMIFQGIQAVALPLVQDFGYTREIEDRVLAPLPVELIALQKVVTGAVQGLLAASIVFPLSVVVPATEVRLDIHPMHLVPVLLLGALLGASLGLAVGTRVEPRQVPLVFGLLVIPMTFLGCAYYPWQALEAIPWLQWFVCINPLVYLSEGLRMSLADGVPHMPAVAIYGAMLTATGLLLRTGVRGFRARVLA